MHVDCSAGNDEAINYHMDLETIHSLDENEHLVAFRRAYFLCSCQLHALPLDSPLLLLALSASFINQAWCETHQRCPFGGVVDESF